MPRASITLGASEPRLGLAHALTPGMRACGPLWKMMRVFRYRWYSSTFGKGSGAFRNLTRGRFGCRPGHAGRSGHEGMGIFVTLPFSCGLSSLARFTSYAAGYRIVQKREADTGPGPCALLVWFRHHPGVIRSRLSRSKLDRPSPSLLQPAARASRDVRHGMARLEPR